MAISNPTTVPLTLTDLPPILQKNWTRRTLSTGEILLQQGDAADYLYWVVSGRIRLVSFVQDQMVTHYFVDAGELLEENALSLPSYSCTAIAETRSEIVAIPVKAFAAALKETPGLCERYLTTLTHRCHRVKSLLELRSLNSARDRIIHYLVRQLMPNQTTVILDKPLRAVASELSITPESLSRILNRLQAEGIITRTRRSITLSKEWIEEFIV